MRYLFIFAGWLSLLLAIIGIILPVLPTAPFLILSAYFFSKGSEQLHQWLLNNPKFGNVLRDWESNGAIRKSAKIKATALIAVAFSVTFYFTSLSILVKSGLSVVGIGVLTFIWTRPSETNVPNDSEYNI